MMLEENLYSWNKGIYNDDKPIKEIKNYYEDNSNLTRGTLYILIYTFFSSIFLSLKDKLKLYFFKRIGTVPKRELKFSKFNSERIREELDFYGKTKQFKIMNFFGQILIIIED